MQTAQAHPQVLTCPACDSQLDRQRFEVVTSRFKQTVSESLDAERRELKAQLARDLAAGSRTAQEAAASLVAAARFERDAAVKRAEDTARVATDKRDAAVAAGVAAAREKWSEEQRQALDEQAALTARREAALNERVSALMKQGEAGARSVQELQAQLREAAERQQELERRFEADKRAAVEGARVVEQLNHARSLAAAESRVKDANDREAAALAREAEMLASVDARVKEAERAAETKARQILEADKQRVLGERAAEYAREKEVLIGQVNQLQRRLADQTPNEIGDGAELDLLEELRREFENDNITRVPKGTPGADVRVEVRERGQTVGLILLDSKDRKSWRSEYATKLRQDQLDAGADHAVLSTTVFPKGKRELCVEADVIVASPRCVVETVRILRAEIVHSHRLHASNDERAGKIEALYGYITSREYNQKLEEVERLHAALLELEVDDKKYHDKTWRNRARMLIQQHREICEIQVEVAAIVENNAAPIGPKT